MDGGLTTSQRGSRLSLGWALRGALLCVVGLALTWIVAHLVPAAKIKDGQALYDFTQLSRPRVDALANGLLRLLDPALYIVWGIGLMGWAFARRRPRVALAISVVLWIGPLSAEILKPLLAAPHHLLGWSQVGNASWPSGHATAAMTLVLCALLAAPRERRAAVAALGSVFAVAVGFSLLVLAWHMPSDVFGGYLLAALWTSLAVAALLGAERRWPSVRTADGAGSQRSAARSLGPGLRSRALRHPEPRWVGSRASTAAEMIVPVAVAGALGSIVGAAVLLRTHRVESFAGDHLSLVVAAVGIGTLAVLICSTMAAALRR